jgi:hypothetical protein
MKRFFLALFAAVLALTIVACSKSSADRHCSGRGFSYARKDCCSGAAQYNHFGGTPRNVTG